MARIVVGVDGSDAARAALEWAVAEAKLRNADVEAVHAWTYPPLTSLTGLLPPPTFAHDSLASEAQDILDRACEGLGAHGVDVRRIVVEGEAVPFLVTRADGADLLVVGSRGRGGFAGLLLGSVSQQCALHAPCPVVIVR